MRATGSAIREPGNSIATMGVNLMSEAMAISNPEQTPTRVAIAMPARSKALNRRSILTTVMTLSEVKRLN
jgi:hypothetical protein